MSRPVPPRWFAPSSIPPILLLTVVTSFAFNHALITTQRKQDLRDHRIRTALLQDTIDYNTRLLLHLAPPSPKSSLFSSASRKQVAKEVGHEQEWIADEREALLRRWKALGLDPMPFLSSSSAAPATTTQEELTTQPRKVGPSDVTWSEIFLGNKETRSTLKQRWQKVTAGIKDSFGQLSLSSNKPSQDQSKDEEDEELQQLSQLWSEFSKQSS
ncbi:hypothetical protein EX895_002324 [Sporisorium graminicola]|uniref:Uncharacterized protein n=1 Tax=Sporisorium graminicola TaxID=280036 RepID=A0A4U7KVR7_9BASI|nr:hypothetical protein EX895_002324 [Sporisorium graminicola]TKY88693.1 hypothetical protein EX895_002324 [Sporisorium graminicola]